MNFNSYTENLNETNNYCLFGPSNHSNQGLLMITKHNTNLYPLSDSSNAVQPPIKSENQQYNSQSCSDRKKLFVGNLPSNTTLDELIELFGKYGRVNRNLSVVKDDNYAFIHYFNEIDAESAHKELNDSFFKSRYIRVQYSISQGHIKKPKSFDLKKNTILSTSSSYSSLASSNENCFSKLTQSQSVFSFNAHCLKDHKQVGRPIKKTNSINKSLTSLCNNFGLQHSHSYEEIPFKSLGNLNDQQIDLNSYIYFKVLLEKAKLHQLQQLEECQSNQNCNMFNNKTINNCS